MFRAVALSLLVACGAETTQTETPKVEAAAGPDAAALQAKAAAVFKPLPTEVPSEANPITEEKVALGRLLYFDARMSKNHDVSCNTCHDLARYGVDGLPTSTGHKGEKGGRNAPTVFNAALHIAQFWDGRSPDVEDQAKGPPLNPIEMAMPDASYVEKTLASIPGYQEAFARAFPGEDNPVTFDNFGKAIGAFERKLVTPSPFDAFLTGETKALDDAQLVGLQTFMDVGCTTCHSGVALGGSQYMKLGLVQPFETADDGRMVVTGNDADKNVFKVPGLRNITETGPYFHDGSVATLDEAVALMGRHQLGKDLTAEQIGQIVTFLGATKGAVDAAYTAAPTLPENGPDTPAPDPA